MSSGRPCLWVEDDRGGAAAIPLPTDFDDVKQLFRALTTQAEKAKSATELVQQSGTLLSGQVQVRNPVSKFVMENLMLTPAKERVIALSCGVAFVLAILIISLLIPAPAPFQYTTFRIIISLAAAGFISMTPGFLNVQAGKGVRAGGALAAFAIVYFFAPAALPHAS